MTALSASAATLCCSLIVVGIVKMLAPNGQCGKILKMVIGLFVLISLLLCIKSVFGSVDIFQSHVKDYVSEAESLQLKMQEDVLDNTKVTLDKYTFDILIKNGFRVNKVDVQLVKTKEDVIYVGDAFIYINENIIVDEASITELIERNLGVSPKYIYGD